MAVCYRHPDRETKVSCSRCDRPICPDCMTPSPVGMRCPECAGERTQVRRVPTGAAASGFDAARATYTLIALNVAAFIAELAGGGGAASFSGGSSLVANGALCGNAVGDGGFCGPPATLTDGGEWWRIVTGGFLHAGFIHLAFNMFVLYTLGSLIEPLIGTARTVGIYALSLVSGSFGALLLAEPSQFTVGASGAIFGLFAATILIARERGFQQAVNQLGFWLVLNLVLTFSISGISIGGHLGGIAGGAIAGLLLIGMERRGSGSGGLPIQLGAFVVLTAAFFVAAIVVAGSGAGPGG